MKYCPITYEIINDNETYSLEELALPLNGKKNNLTQRDLNDYFAETVLKLNQNIINQIILDIQLVLPNWEERCRRVGII